MSRQLLYDNQGRGGSVIYRDHISDVRFYFEFGGGDCVAIIFIPADDEWEKETGRSVNERASIIRFVATQALHDQVSNGSFQISEQSIELYRR